MLDLDRSRDLLMKIYGDKKLCDILDSYILKHKMKIRFCLEFCRKDRWELFLKSDPMLKLSLVYAFLPETKDRYFEKGISDKIFFDTMDDIRIWIDDHRTRTGEYGLYELNWIMDHMRLAIFKLGRLQYQKFKYFFGPSYKKNGVSIKFGENVFSMHIPRGEKLNIEACKKSIEEARVFFKKYYPEYPTNIFVCHSWLLFSGNRNYMREDSNIIKFSEMYDIVKEIEAPSQAYLWIFGKKIGNKELFAHKKLYGNYGHTEDLPHEAKLHKDAIEYIKSGGKLGEGMGVITFQ